MKSIGFWKSGMVLIASASVLTIFAATADSVKVDSLRANSQTDSTVTNKVLLARGTSYWEIAVGKLVVEKLKAHGFEVKVVDIGNVFSQNPRQYTRTIMFGAIKTQARLTAAARKYVDMNGGNRSNLLIATISGQRWSTADNSVNAVTTATKSLNPEVVADRIVQNVLDGLKKK